MMASRISTGSRGVQQGGEGLGEDINENETRLELEACAEVTTDLWAKRKGGDRDEYMNTKATVQSAEKLATNGQRAHRGTR